MSFPESYRDALYRGVGPWDRPWPVHLDLTPGREVTRACGANDGSASAFAYQDEVTCDACRDALADLMQAALARRVA